MDLEQAIHGRRPRGRTLPESIRGRLEDPAFDVFHHAPALIVISSLEQGRWIGP